MSTVAFETWKRFVERGHPYYGVEYNNEGIYHYVTFWDDERQVIRYLVFVKIVADFHDVARAESYMLDIATRERTAWIEEGGEEGNWTFDIEVRGEK